MSDPGSPGSDRRDGSTGADPAGAGGRGGFVFKYQSGSGAVGGIGFRRGQARHERAPTTIIVNSATPATRIAHHSPSAVINSPPIGRTRRGTSGAGSFARSA